MATTKHGLANGHEVRDRVVPIADELYAFSVRLGCASSLRLYFLEVVCDQSLVRISSVHATPLRVLTVASAWFSFTPLASRRCARRPSCDMTSLSSCHEMVSRGLAGMASCSTPPLDTTAFCKIRNSQEQDQDQCNAFLCCICIHHSLGLFYGSAGFTSSGHVAGFACDKETR
jgi:hypothetical protein